MAINHRDDLAMGGQTAEQPIGMRLCVPLATCTCDLCRAPTSVQAVSRRYRQDADIAASLTQNSGGADCFGRNGSLIGDYQIAVRSRFAHDMKLITPWNIDSYASIGDRPTVRSNLVCPQAL